MPERKVTRKTTTVAAGEATVRITEPASGKQKPKVSVIVEPDELVHGFIGFLREHAIVGLAVGFVIGTQVQAIVKQLTSSFIDPLSQLFWGGATLSKRTFTLHFHGRHADFGWGALVYQLIDFLFILFVVYVLIKLFKLDKLDKPTEKKK